MDIDISSIPDKLDNTFIESAIFGLFKLNLVELIKMKAILGKQFHIQPSEIDKMMYWEYEIYCRHLNELVENENNQQKGEMSKYHVDEFMNRSNPNNMKMPGMGMQNMKMPNMNINMPTGFK